MSGPFERRGKHFNFAIFSDSINVINVKHCMMIPIELYTFIPLSVTLNVFQSYKNVKQQYQTIVTESFMFLCDAVKTLQDC